MTSDLALIAERRSGLAALLGLLILEEPNAALAPLVAVVPALAPLASGDPAIASEYERVFLRGTPFYESVFRSDDGQHGGEALAAVVDRYDELGFTEHREARWRVAGADHLGLQLRCYGHLCSEEAAAWRAGTPDLAMATVERERAFLAQHIGAWAPVALRGALDGDSGPYEAVLQAIVEFLGEEFERLRPAPDLGETWEPDPLPANFGPARLSRLLLAPATCGTWLSTATIARAASAIGAPWRPSDNRSALRHVIEDAQNTGDLFVVLEPIIARLDAAVAGHRADATRSPGNAANALAWAQTASTMRAYLADIADAGIPRAGATAAETLTIESDDAVALADIIERVVADLRAQGLRVNHHPN